MGAGDRGLHRSLELVEIDLACPDRSTPWIVRNLIRGSGEDLRVLWGGVEFGVLRVVGATSGFCQIFGLHPQQRLAAGHHLGPCPPPYRCAGGEHPVENDPSDEAHENARRHALRAEGDGPGVGPGQPHLVGPGQLLGDLGSRVSQHRRGMDPTHDRRSRDVGRPMPSEEKNERGLEKIRHFPVETPVEPLREAARAPDSQTRT